MGIDKPDPCEAEIEVVEGESKYEKVEGVTGWEHLSGTYPGEGYVRKDNQGRHVCEMKLEADELDADSIKWVRYLPCAGNISEGLGRYFSFSQMKGESKRDWKIRVMYQCDLILEALHIFPAWEEYRDHGPFKNGPSK